MVTLLVIGLFVLCLFDAMIITVFVVNIIKMLFGENAFSRLLRLVGGIASFGLYGYWTLCETAGFWASTEDISPKGMIISLSIPLILIAIMYIINGNSNSDAK